MACLGIIYKSQNFGKEFKVMSLFQSGRLDIVLSCASGVEKVLKSEVDRLGYGLNPAINGELCLTGDALAVARLNLNLRTADRVYIRLAKFPCTTFDDLYDGVYAVDWKSVLSHSAKVLVNGKCVKSKIFAISACQSIVKKAIVDKLCGKNRSLIEKGEVYRIQFNIFKDECEVLLNTSGEGLHKRGYRDMVGIAPIKETLASALVLLSDYYWQRPFLDPFCGSGTIAIEASKIALDIPGSMGRKFAFEDWSGFDKKHLKTAIENAKDNIKHNRTIEVFASDIDPKAVALAKRHAERAGVGGKIKFAVSDVKEVNIALKNGTIVCNPPYGERVYDRKEAEECYRSLGALVQSLDGWSNFVITPHKGFERNFGKKADRIRKLYNSNMECNYYFYYGKKEMAK